MGMSQSALLKEVAAPDAAESELARDAARRLALALSGGAAVGLHLGDDAAGECVALPVAAVRQLMRVLEQMGEGNAMALTPLQREIGTQQAAEILKVSRPYLVKLLDEGAIPARKVGTHRRVLLNDLLEYKRENDEKRHAIIDEMQAESQAMGLY